MFLLRIMISKIVSPLKGIFYSRASFVFLYVFDYYHFYFEVSRCTFFSFIILGVCGNFKFCELNSFLWETLSHYHFKYCICPVLSLLSFRKPISAYSTPSNCSSMSLKLFFCIFHCFLVPYNFF